MIRILSIILANLAIVWAGLAFMTFIPNPLEWNPEVRSLAVVVCLFSTFFTPFILALWDITLSIPSEPSYFNSALELEELRAAAEREHGKSS